MASFAALYNRIFGVSSQALPMAAERAAHDPYALRSLPNEDIYFFVKDISNARVVRESDPHERTAAWKLIASAGVTAVLLICVLLPSAYGLLAGYQIQSLKAEQQRLVTERSALELEEAKLLSPARLEELARLQKFVDPAPQKVVFLEGKSSVAMNGRGK